jgi:endonuclease/exonuclease/phosphatase (EEP) superfamily protein YafD
MIENSDNYVLYSEKESDKQQCLFNKNNSAINAKTIKVISWNNLAGCRQTIRNLTAFTHCNNSQADQAFLELTKNRDLILIQEAYMDYGTLKTLKKLGSIYSWDMAISYIAHKKEDIPTGVLTVANAKSLSSCNQRAYDTALPTSKAILFTTYNLTNSEIAINNEKLLVVNVHGILFSKKHLYKQLQIMAEKISLHNGPVILAGDFNTMTSKRYLKLKEIVTSIGMIETKNEPDYRVKSILKQPYDFIFFKKLKPIHSHTVNLQQSKMGKTSDHNPLFAEFELLNSKE